MIRFTPLAFLAAVLASPLAAAEPAKKLRIGTEAGFAPYNYLDDKGEVAGFERALMDEACKRLEADCAWGVIAWEGLIPALQSGEVDLIVSAMGITAAREEIISFSRNYTPPSWSQYMTLSPDANITTGVIAVQSTTTQSSYIAEKTDNLMIEFPTVDDAIAAVRNEQADGMFADKNFIQPLLEDENSVFHMIGEPVPLTRGIGAGMRKRDADLKVALDQVFEQMLADGTLNQIITTHLGERAATF